MASPKCGATTRGGGSCGRPAGWGTDHVGVGTCKLHLGSTRTHARAAEVVIARQECERLGVPIEVDPAQSLIQSLFEREGNVAFYRELVQALGEDVYDEMSAVTPSGEAVPTGERRPHVLVELYNREMKERDQVAFGLLKAGVEERRVRMAEGQAQQIAAFARGLMVELGIDPASTRARTAFRKHLELIAGT